MGYICIFPMNKLSEADPSNKPESDNILLSSRLKPLVSIPRSTIIFPELLRFVSFPFVAAVLLLRRPSPPSAGHGGDQEAIGEQ